TKLRSGASGGHCHQHSWSCIGYVMEARARCRGNPTISFCGTFNLWRRYASTSIIESSTITSYSSAATGRVKILASTAAGGVFSWVGLVEKRVSKFIAPRLTSSLLRSEYLRLKRDARRHRGHWQACVGEAGVSRLEQATVIRWGMMTSARRNDVRPCRAQFLYCAPSRNQPDRD